MFPLAMRENKLIGGLLSQDHPSWWYKEWDTQLGLMAGTACPAAREFGPRRVAVARSAGLPNWTPTGLFG